MKNIFIKIKNFQFFFLEIKYKFYYSILLWNFTSITCFFFKDTLLYLLSQFLILEMQTHRFYYQNISDLFLIYINFAIWTGLFFSIPFILIYLFFYIIPSIYKYEFNFLQKIFILSICIYIFSIWFTYWWLIPIFFKFLLIFEQNNFFPIFFEAKLDSYSILIFFLFFKILFILETPLFLHICFFFNIISFEKILKWKKYFYFFFLLLSIIISPPELFTQFIILFSLIFLFEIWCWLNIFLKNIKILI